MIVRDNLQDVESAVAEMKRQCEKLVLAIPDELSFARLYGDTPYAAEEKKQQILAQTQADEVLILGDGSGYEQLCQEHPFDLVFYGARFGRAFERFSSFAAEKNICLSPMLPDSLTKVRGVDALKIALDNLQRHRKVVLFGTGAYFDCFMEAYGKQYPPAYAVDNDPGKQGSRKAGVMIFSPEVLREEKTEDLLIVICAKAYMQILPQIRELGDFDYRPMLYENRIALLEEFALARSGELAYIEKAQTILAEMLKEFDRVCRKHRLRYYMICGSLIGVLRHRGFIPWDDDVDLAMPREDYKRLEIIAPEEWAQTGYRLLDMGQYGNGAFQDCMPRMMNMQTRLPMKTFDKVIGRASVDVADRPFVDLYVMDNAFDDDRKHRFCMNMMKGVYNLLMGHRGKIDYEEYRPRIPEKTIRLMKFLHRVGRCLPLSFLVWWYDHLSEKANRQECENYFMPSCAITCIERKFKKAFFGEGLRMPFTDFEVTVPEDYDGLLKAMGYDGYMQFPRLSNRKPSHYFNSDIVIW